VDHGEGKGFPFWVRGFLRKGVLRLEPGMAIPPGVRAGAWIGWRVGRTVSAHEVERALSAVAERALRHGVRAGLETLVKVAVELTAAPGAALHAGRGCLAHVGRKPPPPGKAHPLQVLRVGRMALVLAAPCMEPERRQLLRLVELGANLRAAQEREEALQAELMRLRRERLRLEERLGQREEGQARVAHDLRTPLMVLQGYLEMMNKGMGGPLTPAMQRYVDRMSRSVGELGTRLQQRSPKPESTPVEELRPLLCATFPPGQSARVPVRLELPEEPLLIRSARPELLLLVRTLSRLLAGVEPQEAVLRVDAVEGAELWRLHLQLEAGRPVPERPLRLLEQLARRMEAPLSVQRLPRLELLLHLPRAAAPSTAK
jgi:hypothetical protein